MTSLQRPLSVALALALTAAPLALADGRIEARRHFRKGMALIAEGRYGAGIEELQVAYELKPHPNVLFNIARAHEDDGDREAALDWYERYLATAPRDAAEVTERVIALRTELRAERDARAQASTDAGGDPGPSGTARSPSSADPDGTRTGDLPSADALGALATRLEAALERMESLTAAAGQGDAPTHQEGGDDGMPAPEAGDALPEGDASRSDTTPYEEQVVTASRRAQSTLEAPNATTIITGEEIRRSGATSLVELLRRVPGAEVMAMGVGSANVSLRGFNRRIANKVLVLLDGRTEYQDFLGMTIWSALPVGLDEIDRIEVIRGPGSALYGANAMLGVINIITRRPGTGAPLVLSGQVGSGDRGGVSLVASGQRAPLRYRASAAYEQSDKWSRDFDDARPDVAPRVPETDLGVRSVRANLRTEWDLSSTARLGAAAGLNQIYTEIYPLGLLRNFYFDGLSSYVQADLHVGAVAVKSFWNRLAGTAGPQYSALGSRSLENGIESNVVGLEGLWSDTFSLFGEHRVTVGAEGRLKYLQWGYLPGDRSELHAAAFVQDEWRLFEPLQIVASYRVDRHPLLDQGSPGLAHSPRVSAVWRPFEGHAFRAGWATAFREPTFLESYVDIRIPVPDVPGASAATVGSRTLRPEQLVAYELGYRGDSPALGLEWDLSLYQNGVRELIGLSAFEPVAPADAFDPLSGSYVVGRSSFRNEPARYTATGMELGARFSPLDGLYLIASGAFQTVQGWSLPAGAQCGPCREAPPLKLFASASYRAPAGIELGVEAAYASGTTWIEREPSAADPSVTEFVSYGLPAHLVVHARVGYTLIPNRVEVALVGTHLGPGHAQHPFGNQIEQRFLATVRVTP